MSGVVDVVLIAAVVVLVVVRQFRTRRVDTDRRWWIGPGVLAVLAVREPGLLDAHHRVGSAVLLAVELLIGLAVGAGWAWTSRIWAEPDGGVWSRSTTAGVVVWGVGIVLRAALFGVGAALGISQDSSALVMALAATLLVRSGILTWRARSVSPAVEGGTADAPAVGRPAWKEPV
ncbi:DUF1453 domain-containing protein [Streptomyces griseoaurantiacus]|uniref:DUF1453 domain-containing protein n=1 Tax=Streptomyces griseoaurantiacus TaxID=68213 RepID=UPI002ED1802D|nr:DUF1453 domain-containing protein [Streptomyces jietaisiensis]